MNPHQVSFAISCREPASSLSRCLAGILICLCCLSTAAWSDGRPYTSLIAGKNISLRLCFPSDTGEVDCSSLLASLTGPTPPPPLTPELTIANSEDVRLRHYGVGCPPTGADIRGDPYQPFEHEYNGERGIPAGPFEIFNLSRFYPDWNGHSIVKVQGYGPKNFGHLTPAFGWTAFYIVQSGGPCPIAWLAGKATGGFDQPPHINYSNDLVHIDGEVLLIELSEVANDSDVYYGTVSLLAIEPSTSTTPKKSNLTVLLTFTAE